MIQRRFAADCNGNVTIIAAACLAGLIGFHLYLVVRLGVTSPPWSDEEAGAERPEPEPVGRSGLVAPGARGGSPR